MKKILSFIFVSILLLSSCGTNNDEKGRENKSFWSFDCTDDCSWHEAGYNWAESKDISQESDCDNWSNSFTEWCLFYVNRYY